MNKNYESSDSANGIDIGDAPLFCINTDGQRSEHPILFSTPMAQAILEGRKIQTRRIVKMTKDEITNAKWGYTAFTPKGHISVRGIHANGNYGESFIKCPYGKVGDLLWVRETFVYRDKHDKYYYKADHQEFAPYAHSGWKPSIHMPKDACRIWLEITDIKVERLQDISEEDAQAEGAYKRNGNGFDVYRDSEHKYSEEWGFSFKIGFQSLWQKINGEESWNQNPWVWVVSFKVLSTNGKPNSSTGLERSVAENA